MHPTTNTTLTFSIASTMLLLLDSRGLLVCIVCWLLLVLQDGIRAATIIVSIPESSDIDNIQFNINGIFWLRGGGDGGNHARGGRVLPFWRRKASPSGTGTRASPLKKNQAITPNGTQGVSINPQDSTPQSKSTSSNNGNLHKLGRRHYNPLRMYVTCLTIVSLWITTGTLFYSICNDWPIPQSFFYAVDAGMSIGFCTDVVETKLISKAFTILYILLGASVVGGALALFIQDSIEGINDNQHDTKEYQLLLEQKVFEEFNVSRSGVLSLEEFRQLLHASTEEPLSEHDIQMLWTKFDRLKDGVIHFEEFAGTYRGVGSLIASLHESEGGGGSLIKTAKDNNNGIVHKVMKPIVRWLSAVGHSIWHGENRIYFVFVAWVLLGVAWGMLDQGWDPITATHFAVSALATGGLTAPPVNSLGILPAEPAIFCGFYCLMGVPLMAVTLGHFARVLVAGHVAAMEMDALTRPMTATEYNVAKQSLAVRTSHAGRGLHLGDFVVLQLMRQGRLSVETFEVLKREFELLDKDQTGMLTLEEATNWSHEEEASESDNKVL